VIYKRKKGNIELFAVFADVLSGKSQVNVKQTCDKPQDSRNKDKIRRQYLSKTHLEFCTDKHLSSVMNIRICHLMVGEMVRKMVRKILLVGRLVVYIVSMDGQSDGRSMVD